MRTTDSDWVFSDAWVFTAIGISGAPCDLTRLMSIADGINHAIVRDDEVESALGKLAEAGLVQVNDDWTMGLTPAGETLFARRRGNLFSQVDSVLKLLARTRASAEPLRLPSDALDGAIKRYLARPPG